ALGRDEVGDGDGVVGEGAVEVAEADVRAAAAAQDVLDLRVRLRPAEALVEADHGELRHGQPEALREAPDDQLGDERAGALPGPAKLHHEEAAVGGLDDGGERAALAQRERVAGGGSEGESVGHRSGGGVPLVAPATPRVPAPLHLAAPRRSLSAPPDPN